jgi:RHS repeat-associated protein
MPTRAYIIISALTLGAFTTVAIFLTIIFSVRLPRVQRGCQRARHSVAFARMLIALILLGVLTPSPGVGQSSVDDVPGIPADASIYPIPGVGFVNLNNGNLHIEIPLYSKKDRNGVVRTTSIAYDNSTYHTVQLASQSGGPQSYWTNIQGDFPAFGSALRVVESPSARQVQTHDTVSRYMCGNTLTQQISNYQFIDEHGTIHDFGLTTFKGVPGCADYPNAQGYTLDGSGYWMEVSGYYGITVFDMHGNILTSGEDANGNIPKSNATDLLGRDDTTLLSGFTQQYKTINVWTDFGFPVELGPVQGQAISTIGLPDGRNYQFQYDDAGPPNAQGQYAPSQQGHYGTLTGITLPTGGQITIKSALNQSNGNINPLSVTQITTPDGIWKFSYAPATGYVTVTAPIDPRTGLASQTTVTGTQTLLTVSTYAGSVGGTPLRSVKTANPSRPTSITTTLDNGQSSHVDYTYTDICTPRIATKKEYDFSGGLLRETDVTYPTTASDNTNLCKYWEYNTIGGPTWSSPYLQGNLHVIAIPQSVKVYGPSGVSGGVVAETDYTYDSTALSTTSGSAGTSVLGLPIHDDVNFGASMKYRGNPTVIKRMVSIGNFVTTTNTYNILGELVQTVDGRGKSTSFDYSDSWNGSSCITTPVFAYPTTKTNALGQHVQTAYNSCDGTVASVRDQNDLNASRAGTVYTYDGRQRVTKTIFPDLGITTSDYGGHANPEVITTTITATPSPNLVSTTTLDGLGRTTKSVAPGGGIVDTKYDPLGRVASVSNPHLSSPNPATDGTTTYGYDALGRTVLQCQPDNGGSAGVCAIGNSYLQWSYNGNITTFYDENRKQWQRTTDALGRLTNVTEDPAGKNLPTSYLYSPLNDITSVTQTGNSTTDAPIVDHPRQRNFRYDSLSRLVQTQEPETNNGYTCYGTTGGTVPNGANCTPGYDANGNLTAKTDARGVTTTFGYDDLNRLTSKTYSDSTPPVSYKYDETAVSWVTYTGLANTIGRLSSASVGGTTAYSRYAYSYDPNGRLSYKLFSLPNSAGSGVQTGVGSSSFSYDLAGNVTFTDLGNGVHLNQIRDGSGRTKTATSNKHTTSLLNNQSSYTLFDDAVYTASGGLSTRLLGNGLTETRNYDNRGRTTSTTLSQTGLANSYFFSVSYSGNGNVNQSNDAVNGSYLYGYDNLNRLTNAQSAGLSLSWKYDSFGNRWSQSAAGTGSAPQPSFTFNSNTNRADASGGFAYDFAGNVKTDNLGQTYTYDAEGRISSALSGTVVYKYDSDGQLVYESGSHGVQVFARNPDGQATIISNPTSGGPPYNMIGSYIDGEQIGSWQTDRFFWAGRDWLGTKRFESAGAGDIMSTASPIFPKSYTSLPYGDALSSIGTDPTHFTGKERDAESGNDYFGARFYSSSTGRFMSPDYSDGDPVPYADFSNPQSLNLYAYAGNNPLTNTDADGHTYNVCPSGATSGSAQCTNIDDKTFEAEQKQDQANGVSYAHGTISDSSGVQGTYTHDPDIRGDSGANIAAMGQIGNQGMGAIKYFVAGSVIGGAAGGACLAACPFMAGSGLVALNLTQFVAGQTVSIPIVTATGEAATITARVAIQGGKLILENLDINGAAGRAAFQAALSTLKAQAAASGFTTLVITNTLRISGANPDRLIHMVINLK